MGTHAMIGIWNKTSGEVFASYVHYNGYLEGVGKTLVNFYNDHIRAQQVALGGYLSGLSKNYEQSKSESVHNDPTVRYKTVEEYLKIGCDYAGAEYLYLWDGDAWFFAAPDIQSASKFEEVQMNLKSVDTSIKTV